MSTAYLSLQHLDMVFEKDSGGTFTALQDIHLDIHQGEFVH